MISLIIESVRTANVHTTKSTPWTNYVNRPIALPLVQLFAAVRVGPNVVTSASLMVSVAAILILAQNPEAAVNRLSMAVLLQLSYALDIADGTLARLTRQTSVFGQWYDLVIDRLNHTIIVGGIMIVCWQQASAEYSYFHYHIALLMVLGVSLAHLTAVNLRAVVSSRYANRTNGTCCAPTKSVLRIVAGTALDYGFLLFALSAGVILNSIVPVALGMTCIHALGLVTIIARMYSSLRPQSTV